MLAVPFPVITLLILLFLLLIPSLSEKTYHHGTLYFLASYMVILALDVARWGYDSDLLRDIQSGVAMFLPPIAWYCFVSMTKNNRRYYEVLLFLPSIVSLCIRMIWPYLTDVLLVLLFIGFGCSLLRIACRADYKLVLSKLGYYALNTNVAFLAGCILCISALTDLLVSFDFSRSGGKLAPTIIITGQIILYPVIIFMVIFSGRMVTVPTPDARRNLPSTHPNVPEDNVSFLYERIEKQVRESQIYLNPDLTLIILARKTGIPARQLSNAVNTVVGCNVSQWINGFRIERAKGLLSSTPLSITDIMLDSGFMTKSNFNREFQRVVGFSPTLFRQQERDNEVMSSKID